MAKLTESEKLWNALVNVTEREPADLDSVVKLAALGFVTMDNDTPIPTPRGMAALNILESGDGEVPELDGA